MRLAFSTQGSRKIDTRDKPSKFNKSTLRNTIRDLGQGDNLSDVFYAYKYLPVQMQDTTTEDYIVIPKGRVVSLLTHYNASSPVSGMLTPSGASSIHYATSAIDSGPLTTLIDDTFYGYPNSVAGLLIPANGGLITSGQYTARDVTNGTLGCNGTALTAAPILPANLPIGVMIGDVYQDIRGKNLNYQMWDKAVAVCTDWYIEVPYVKISPTSSGSYTTDPSTPDIVGTSMTFDTMNSKYTYLTLNYDSVYKAGTPVKSDVRGNYKTEVETSAATGFSTYPITAQTVGRIILTDCRFPKDLLETVDTYEGSNMPGTATAGIPSYLFNFAHDFLVATSANNRLTDVVAAIQGGQFGAARILINI